MKKSSKAVRIISWIFSVVLLVVSIIGVQHISNEIPINFTLNGGADWYGSKYFIFLYPVISLIIGITGMLGVIGNKKETGEKASLLYIIIANVIVGGIEVYTVISNWCM